jgi:hypothetical protein
MLTRTCAGRRAEDEPSEGGGGGGRATKGLNARIYATTQQYNNIPCVCMCVRSRARVSILLCSSPDVNETKIEIWREKNTHYYSKVAFTIFVYYNNVGSTPPHLVADISPLRRPFRSERFNARRRRRRPRRATKKPYNIVIIIIIIII